MSDSGIPKSANKPLDVSDYGMDGPYILSKGWHESHRFKAQARKRGFDVDGCHEPQHVWLRCVPDSSGEYAYQFRIAEPGSRGAFAATLALDGIPK